MSSKRYSEEFKIEADKQMVDRGHSVSSVATRLDIITPGALGHGHDRSARSTGP